MDCSKEKCKGDNRIRNCQCYSVENAGDVRMEQFCGHEVDGYIYPCEPGCCHKGRGCPGQCKCVRAVPPYNVVSPNQVVDPEVVEERPGLIIDITILSAIALIILNIIALFSVRGLKK